MDDSCDRLLKVKRSYNIAPGVVDLSVVEDENYIKGGILSNNKLSWVSCGPRITNLNNNNGSKKTGWTFGWASGDKTIRVVCVKELNGSSSASPILVVGCESDNGSSLCFYHSGCSRVLKAINFHDKVTSLAVVSKTNDSEENLSKVLKHWNGVLAVGTSVGKVYLVDVWWKSLERCIDDYKHRLYDEQRQSKLVEVTVQDLRNEFDCKTSSIRHGSSTLALWINERTFEQGRVGAHPGLHNILGRMPLEFLAVSALEYFPQISTLAVGYNTSCFQLWDLETLTLLYTSALLEAMLPVFSFSLLEPSDDPRYVCYLWSMHHSLDEDNIPFAGMYIISYHEKHLNPYRNQYFYEGFSSCSIRYQLDLGADMADVDVASGRIISCQAIQRSTTKSSPLWIHTESEESGAEEGTASLLSIAWEVWTPNQLSVYRKLTLFDLNQWYREYMPTSSDMEYSQFMAHFCLPDGQLLDVRVIPSSVKQFQALQPLDEHFYPTATSFDCLVLHQSQLLVCSHVGVQQEALELLTEAGPSGLLLPACLYKQCTQAGLRPLLVDINTSHASIQSSDQRTYLLSVALEHELTQYLRQCVAHWADGSHAVAGCTLPALLGWAWDRVQRYKKWLDRLCVPLFDYSGTALDTKDLGIFHHMICQFHRLRDLFRLVLDKYGSYIIRGNFEQQYTVINLVAAFYDAVFWCVRNNILPEVNASEANINGCIPYFTDKIINSTISRRAELHQVAKCLQDPAPAGLLLIDAVIAQEAGPRVTDQWEREGSAATLGKYPPASVQSLLRTYLIRNVPPDVKHFIVTYFLLDVAQVVCSLGASERIKDKILKYPTDFGLTESQSKIVEAFWCLDHKQFQSGVELLLDSDVCKEDLQVYQHRTVLCLLAAVGEHKLALHYLTTRRGAPTEPQDVRMEMSLLLANELIHEAFQFQRHHQSMSTELLEQFFKGCVKMNKLDVVFKLALTPAEEEAFMAFLGKTCHPQADDLRVLYLLSRSRYVEAIDVNEKLHSAMGVRRGMGLSPAPGARKPFGGTLPTKTQTTRDLIVNSVSKSLPSITRDLADYCHREKHFSWKQIDRPKPLSVVVHTELSKERLPYYKTSDSQLIQAAVSKTREIWAPLLATPAALKRKLQPTVEETPFLRNHIHPRLNSSVANLEEVRSGVRSRVDDEESKISKRARLEFSPSEKEKSRAEINLDKSSDMEITCAVSSAVLHTPLVARIVKKPPREVHTPQSILKGRSGPNTPLTPARDRLGSPAVARQIRFSLPQDKPPSPVKSEEESQSDEGEHLKSTLSPRKSIHETSDLHSRLPTPSNPRVLQKLHSHSLRSSINRLQFDDLEPSQNEDQPELSSTAVTLLKKISSSPNSSQLRFDEASLTSQNHKEPELSTTAVTLLKKISSSPHSSEDAYFSFQSSSSGVENNKSDTDIKFKIAYGLDGNVETQEDEIVEEINQDQTYREDEEEGEDVDVYKQTQIGVSEREMESCDPEASNTYSKTSFAERKSVVFKNQTNESMHLTLEYKGDASSLHTSSEHLPVSLENVSAEITINQCDKIANEKCVVTEAIETKVKSESTKENLKKGRVSHLLLEEKVLAEQDTAFNTIQVDQAIEPLQEHDMLSGGRKIKTEASIENFIGDFSLQNSSLQLVLEKEPSAQSIFITEPFTQDQTLFEQKLNSTQHTVENILADEEADTKVKVDNNALEYLTSNKSLESPNKEIVHDSTLLSHHKELESDNMENQEMPMIKEVTVHETSSKSVRASTPLPQILEELVQKGRISLSVAENESGIKLDCTKSFLSVDDEKNLIVSSSSEEPVSVEYTRNEERFVDKTEIETEAGCESAILNKTSSENQIVSAKEETHTVPTKAALKQMFVFGNQASLSTSAVNSNLTFTIGTNVFGCSSWEDQSLKTDTLLSNKSVSSGDDTKDSNDGKISGEPQQVCSLSDEPKELTIISSESIIGQAHSFEDVYVEDTTNKDPIVNLNSNTPKISQVFSSDLPEDDQIQTLEFSLDTGISTSKLLESDSLADYELKMSEGESVVEVSYCEDNDEVGTKKEGTNEEPVFQTLRPVEYQVDEEIDAEVYDQHDAKEDADDEDIYGDLEEEEEGNNMEDENELEEKESDHEEDEKEVICLESSSDEEPPAKFSKSSTPSSHQLSHKALQESKIHNETLDYELEDEDDEDEEDSDEQEERNETSSSESSYDGSHDELDNEIDSKIEKKNHYFSSESESDTSYRRRSWKEQRKEYGSNESLTKEIDTPDEDSVESPPFELISQDGQKGFKETLETIVEETKDKSPKDETRNLNDPPLVLSVPSENITNIIEDQKAETTLHNALSIETSSISSKSEKPIVENNVDIIKMAEANRQRRLETGSIHELKKRRSKRYSSVTDLSDGNKLKLRRRSCSFHDFVSIMIKENVTVSSTSPEKEVAGSNTTLIVNVSQASSINAPNTSLDVALDNSSVKIIPSLTSQQTITSETEFNETGSVTSSLIPEIGSVASNHTSICDVPISNFSRPLESLKRKGKSCASRLSSLHDISEESAEITDSLPQNHSNRRSLRRSISTDQLAPSAQINDSRLRRSNSVCRWSDYAKAHESEISSDYAEPNDVILSEDTSRLENCSKSGCSSGIKKVKRSAKQEASKSDEKNESVQETIDASVQNEEMSERQDTLSSKDNVCDESYTTAVENNEMTDFAVQASNVSRWLRAQSEPSLLAQTLVGSKRSRRSSSSMKINEYHKKILCRSSLKGKSFEPQEFQIIESDSESPKVATKEKVYIEEDTLGRQDEKETVENNFENMEVDGSKETIDPTIVSKASPNSEDNERTRRGQSEPPAAVVEAPKTRSRTRRSSFSHKIDKVHKLVLPRLSRNLRASVFEPMEILQSDEEKSFHETPKHNKQSSEPDIDHQTYEKNHETPVTTKKISKQKQMPSSHKKDNLTSETNDSSPITQEDPQVASKTTQDYPQPPKKRGRRKGKAESEIETIDKDVTEDNQEATVSPVQDLTKPQSKKTKSKTSKTLKQDCKEAETDSGNEPINLKSISDNEGKKSKGSKTSGPKKRKETSALNIQSSEDQLDAPLDVLQAVSQDQQTKISEKSEAAKKTVSKDELMTPKKNSKRKNKDIATPSKEQSDSEHAESSLTESQADEMAKPTTANLENSFLDSPARRTRRSVSRMSDTEMFTPSKDKPQRRTRRSSIMSDVGLSTPNKYAASEISDASTEVNVYLNTPSKARATPVRRSSRLAESDVSDVSTELNMTLTTPTRKSNRRRSISATINTPELIPEELLMQRRLTRHQHSQLQKSFELSFAESPKLPRLEEVPEEGSENNDIPLTPVRSSRRSKPAVSKGSKNKTSKK